MHLQLGAGAGPLPVEAAWIQAIDTESLEEADEKLELSPEVANLVIPLGASLNRAGSALFQGASIVFLAALFDVTIPVASLVGVVFATFLVAMTVAPVPSAGVMTLAPALDTAGVPLGGMAILLGVDRIPDMFRSATNMIGHMVAAVIVDARVGTDPEATDRDGRDQTSDGPTSNGPTSD